MIGTVVRRFLATAATPSPPNAGQSVAGAPRQLGAAFRVLPYAHHPQGGFGAVVGRRTLRVLHCGAGHQVTTTLCARPFPSRTSAQCIDERL